MAIKIAINHNTSYKYDRYISLSPHLIRLRPAAHCRTNISAYSLKIKPENHFINWQQDPFGNYVARVVFPEKTNVFSVNVEVIADMVVINPFDFFVESYAEFFPFEYEESLKSDLMPYLAIGESGPLLKQLLSEVNIQKQTINDFLVKINQLIYRKVGYTVRLEPGVQTCEETLTKGLGSCRDSAWLLVQLLRHIGLASRFVSGYLVQLAPDLKSLEGPTGPEKDFTDLHAWTEVYLPGAGWVGLDSTSGLFAGEGHIPLACTPTPGSASPITGLSDKAETEFAFSNEVTRVHEDPRVTKPYSEEQWETINAVGKKIDVELERYDARLTMGGEPTFVSIDDMEAPEWNTAAEGAHKRERGGDLLLRLHEKFTGNRGLLHYGQGKWYPGEPLPRWQLGLYWRLDGEAIWKEDKYLAKDDVDYEYSFPHVASFARQLVKYLDIKEKYIINGYEDVFYNLWEENKLPLDQDPLKSSLKDPLERQRLSSILNTGLDEPVGVALPVKWNYATNSWQSRTWQFRRKNMFLVPGTSPMGYRLPLNSLEEIDPTITDVRFNRDLFAPVPEFSNFETIISERFSNYGKGNNRGIADNGNTLTEEAPHDNFRTALCIEAREGIIHVFFPPLDLVEQYLELIAAVEATAKQLSVPVRIEGYTPPRDVRIQNLVVTPDPGVIEVNIHPAQKWEELVSNYSILHDEAFLSRLSTEKFMLDGRHTGSGGGNHITLGSTKPENSPFLRRPDILRSFIAYWQNHPGLSYLFAGEFIGPTSQAPRFDEGRDDKIYEMEIAFSQIPESDNIPYWITDRLFRHLLTDLTGNTHRSELCIDKLYSPDSSSGRLGILELRAFDMPPHFRMSVVQLLLIRALFLMLWKNPYKQKLVRWGTELHDRFMLPHYVETDLKNILQDLNEAGIFFEKEWLNPFFEFRFPTMGGVQINDVVLELKKGIEPWHVLGEEATSSGTARYVDSSLERLQLKLTGLTNPRYVVTCNGIKVNLNPTGVQGEFVTGIRFRAWQPPSGLHPTIGIDSPLVFDIIDSWNGRSIGGCVYHVIHPGGRSYEIFPINANEAEARRSNRFWNYNHTPGPVEPNDGREMMEEYFANNIVALPLQPTENEKSKEYPYTLDLRIFAK